MPRPEVLAPHPGTSIHPSITSSSSSSSFPLSLSLFFFLSLLLPTSLSVFPLLSLYPPSFLSNLSPSSPSCLLSYSFFNCTPLLLVSLCLPFCAPLPFLTLLPHFPSSLLFSSSSSSSPSSVISFLYLFFSHHTPLFIFPSLLPFHSCLSCHPPLFPFLSPHLEHFIPHSYPSPLSLSSSPSHLNLARLLCIFINLQKFPSSSI